MITISNLNKSFKKLSVLKNVSMSFDQGSVTAIIGPNGSGKTTLIKCLMGMVKPDKGDILFNKRSILNQDDYRKDIGYMAQIGRYPDHMKIGQLFDMMKDIRKNYQPLETDEDLTESFQLRSMFHKPMHTLSGGTRQKVSAALAFLFNPPVLILDEPTAGLDPESAMILKSKILSAKEQGKLILVTSHIMTEVAEIADKVAYLLEGRIAFYMPVEHVLEEAGEERFSKAIVKLIKQHSYVENR